tara:strand:- start:25755 stop:26714 length:960 start_codon:yes stop_codon:yes gene_type:complete
MGISFKDLTVSDKAHITDMYDSHRLGAPMLEIQTKLAEEYNVSKRCIRNWANRLDLNRQIENLDNPFKVLVYDIETCQVPAMVFWTGKTYINHKQLKEEPKIISISYKWLGTDEVHSVEWDSDHCDEQLMRDFLPIYNQSNMVVGYNNDNFDNKWINARAVKHRLDVNLHVKSFDVYKQAKRIIKIPSYSMAYLCKYFGVTLKQSHEGIKMWEMIQSGTVEQQREYLDKMLAYNVGDIISTEELYLGMRKYFGHKTHLGVILGEGKDTCPNCGGSNIEEYNGNLLVTAAGTIQRHMICLDDKVQFKMSNSTFLKIKDSV